MTTTAALPAPADVAERARAIHAAWQADAEMQTVLDGCAKYSSDWDDFYGGPLISTYSVARDAGHLLVDALRVMALKTAVYELTGDELLAELPVPVPVDVTCHALCAQFTALSRIQQRTGHPFVHSTVNEHVNDTPWDTGDFTHRAYEEAFGPVNDRYWIPAEEAERRRRVLDGKYASIGITERGMTSAIDYAATA
ncbi:MULTISPECIES: hypothetical protein [Streptomyces]|uniref:hypothetical protein n=1 Tax=Streptomyces TaxID=1883 RepID=UPI00073DBB48|nr:hypothetical protein [Streptomyces sp. FBKL.4005]OYP10242.1 hypothetical protein CFC35_41345 [Streptomyces sp. FBKL.4005]CUW33440.1 hypothetical protein TUE45_pSRTUE45a_0072 [Streptomyces reticuli]